MNEQDEKVSILVVDDNRYNLEIMEAMLADLHFEVRVALNGRDALNSVQNKIPELILLDIHMPEMDGYEVCKHLKQQEATKHIPIIFVSTLSEQKDKLKGFTLGAVDYVTKPINEEEVRARVSVHLDLHRQRRQLELQAKELKSFNETMLDREMRVIELKLEVNQLCDQQALPTRYEIPV